jgi:hypothetical protein
MEQFIHNNDGSFPHSMNIYSAFFSNFGEFHRSSIESFRWCVSNLVRYYVLHT